jgi:hypothetical protein
MALAAPVVCLIAGAIFNQPNSYIIHHFYLPGGSAFFTLIFLFGYSCPVNGLKGKSRKFHLAFLIIGRSIINPADD